MRSLPVIENEYKTERQRYEEKTRQIWESISLHKLDPLTHIEGTIRIERTLQLLVQHGPVNDKQIADIGCGVGTIAIWLAEQKARVTAIDVSQKALDVCQHPAITRRLACIPYLSSASNPFDGMICTDVIAEIDPALHRLSLSEIAHLLRNEGWVVISSHLDFYSVDAIGTFLQLVNTEFTVVKMLKSYHRFHFYISRWVLAPSRFVKAGRDEKYRFSSLEKRRGIPRLWFLWNSSKGVCCIWKPIAKIMLPLAKALQNRRIFLSLEWLTKRIWGENGVSHVIVLALKKKI